jgi:hypothetical protein
VIFETIFELLIAFWFVSLLFTFFITLYSQPTFDFLFVSLLFIFLPPYILAYNCLLVCILSLLS